MRLNHAELDAIRSTLRTVDPAGRTFLYGSRVDDARRGDDIDVFLDASRPIDLKAALTTQVLLSAACDTKVDLLVKGPENGDMPIHQIARRGVPL